MITFFEGLPRSGKSYSAVKDYVIPMLKNGRAVYANIAGLNHPLIADLADISEERCPQRWKPSPEMTTFITQHGHLGLDILLMGQSVKDIHVLWRRRIETLFFYEKRSALGKPNQYKVISYRAVRSGNDVKFEHVKTDRHEYDQAIFGTYKSHTDGTENKETLVDERTVIWNNPAFKKFLMPFAVCVLFAIGYLVWGFTGGFAKSAAKKSETVQKSVQQSPYIAHIQPPPPKPAPQEKLGKASDPMPTNPIDPVADYTAQYRLRLAGFVRVGGFTKIVVEWRDADDRLIQRLTTESLQALGYGVFISADGTMAVLQNSAKRFVAMNWQLNDRSGQVSQNSIEDMKPPPRGPYYVPGNPGTPPWMDQSPSGPTQSPPAPQNT